MAYESLEVLAAPVTLMGAAMLKMWRDSSRTREIAEQALRETQRHDEKCQIIQKEQAKVNQTVLTASEEISAMRTTQTWVGDCIVGIASKMDVRIPQRPK